MKFDEIILCVENLCIQYNYIFLKFFFSLSGKTSRMSDTKKLTSDISGFDAWGLAPKLPNTTETWNAYTLWPKNIHRNIFSLKSGEKQKYSASIGKTPFLKKNTVEAEEVFNLQLVFCVIFIKHVKHLWNRLSWQVFIAHKHTCIFKDINSNYFLT